MDKYYEWIKETLKSENIDLDQLNNSPDAEVLDQIQNAVRDLRDSLELVRQHIGLTEGNLYSRAKVHTCAVHGDKLVISDTEEGAAATSKLEDSLPKSIKERHVSSKTKCMYLGLPYYFDSDHSDSPDSSDLEAINDQCKKLKDQYLHLLHKKKGESRKKKTTQEKPSSSSQTIESSTLESQRGSEEKRRPKKPGPRQQPPVPIECNQPDVSTIEDSEVEKPEVVKPEVEVKKPVFGKTEAQTQTLCEEEPVKLENPQKLTRSKKIDFTTQTFESTSHTEVVQDQSYQEIFDQLTNGRKLHKVNNCIFLDPEPLLPRPEKYLVEESFTVNEVKNPEPDLVEVTVKQPEPKKYLVEETFTIKEVKEQEPDPVKKPKRRSSSKKRKTVKEFASQTSPKKPQRSVKFQDHPPEKAEASSQTYEETYCPFYKRHAGETNPVRGQTHSSSQTEEEMQQVTTTSANMAARIDLHIKVSSNVSTETETKNEASSKEEDTPKLTIRVVSEENLNVNANDVTLTKTSSENLNVEHSGKMYHSDSHLDVDNISVHSMSEGDNSVFTDGQVTPTEEGVIGGEKRSGKTSETNQEEVDDIELIFSSDDQKDYGQDDLVSIGEFEPWQEPGTTGTPVLIKFKKTSSLEKENKENKVKRQDSGAQTDNEHHRSLESDSFSCDVRQEGTTKSSSLEKESSFEQDVITRDESFDTFEAVIPTTTIQRRWTKASILVETDISKCGITEEITEEALLGMPRRNTCPNPAPYR